MSELTEEQQAQAEEYITNLHLIIGYCRDKNRQVKGFGLVSLDQIAIDQCIPGTLKEKMKHYIENPDTEPNFILKQKEE